MTHRIRHAPAADRDLAEIADYTFHRWGEQQAVRYMRELGDTITSLTDSPLSKGQQQDDLQPGLRSIQHRTHYRIFFRVAGDDVEIARVLHLRRDWHGIMSGS